MILLVCVGVCSERKQVLEIFVDDGPPLVPLFMLLYGRRTLHRTVEFEFFHNNTKLIDNH